MRLLGLTVLLLGTSSTVAAASAMAPVMLEDVLGESVPIAPAHPQRATVLLFMGTRDADRSRAFARAIDEQILNGPIETVGVVDVRRYAGLLTRRLVMDRLRKSARESRERRRQRRLQHGIDASPPVVNRWHLVGDFDGAVFSRFGVDREPASPVAWLVDRAGVRHGPYRDVSALLDGVARVTRTP